MRCKCCDWSPSAPSIFNTMTQPSAIRQYDPLTHYCNVCDDVIENMRFKTTPVV